ncbi:MULTISPECIES: growth inhibitor PemK [unclassified Inquilinus]|uniref:growth inhibitor PemK n=1 Tax=unclassified Inquilinus TaxID=2645927 RepID=UPI003F932DFB
MSFPEPKPGLIVRYDYLWTHEAERGQDQGKDRPTCLVAASDSATRPRYVVLLPITHTPPSGDTIGIEIPTKVKQAIGLDDVPSWVIVSEHNIDEWPNGGLSPVPGKAGVFAYGFIPPGLFARVKAEFLELARRKKTGGVRR